MIILKLIAGIGTLSHIQPLFILKTVVQSAAQRFSPLSHLWEGGEAGLLNFVANQENKK